MYLLDPHPVFHLGKSTALPIYTHGLFFAAGAAISGTILARQLKKEEGLRFSKGLDRALLIFLVGLLGARLGYLLAYIDQWNQPWQLIAIWQGGLLSYTGIAAGLIAAWWFVRKKPRSAREHWYDMLTYAGLWGWAIGRLGNYYAADSYGVMSAYWAPFYHRVPIPLFEAVLCVLLAVLLVGLRKRLAAGEATLVALAGYFAGRFVIDFWRDESQLAGLHLSQWVSLLLFAVILMLWSKKYRTDG